MGAADPTDELRALLGVGADASVVDAVRALVESERRRSWEAASLNGALEAFSDRLLGFAAGDHAGTLDEATGNENIDAIALGLNMLVEDNEMKSRELAIARDLALQANTAKSAFLANMSHELRTPLNAIIGYSELIADVAEEEAIDLIADDIHKILKAARHLLALISDVLDLSKVEAGRMEVYLTEVQVPVIVQEIADTVRPTVEANGNRLVVDPVPEVALTTDEVKLRQILLNLLGNAAKFTRDGEVRITSRLVGGELELDVTDTGTGIPEDRLEAIFEPFTQAAVDTSSKFGGTGLGLAITQRFCELLGGGIRATSTVGRGSTFTVALPRNVSASPKPQAAQTPVPIHARQDLPHVLVVDDDVAVLEIVERHLAPLRCEVVRVESGTAALELARERPPSVVILDVLMPEADGWAILAQLKADPATEDVPVIMMSVIDERVRGMQLGAADYLMKPFDR